MPNTKAAKKALRSSLRKRKINKVKKNKMTTALKEFRKSLTKDPKKTDKTMAKAYSALDKAVKSNYISKKKADRKKSRIAKTVAKALDSKKK